MILVRRLTLLYMAMFLAQYSWLQVSIFTVFSAMQIWYLGFTEPFKSRRGNSLQLFNEGITCLVSYQLMVLNGLCHRADQYQYVGDLVVYMLYLCWGVNGVIFVGSIIYELKRLVKKCCVKAKNRWFTRKNKKSRAYREAQENNRQEEQKESKKTTSRIISRKKSDTRNFSQKDAVSSLRKSEISVIEENSKEDAIDDVE